jgi:hypothetical protein
MTGVLWPEEYRDATANTAAEVLNAILENTGRNIAAIQILGMLGYNPTYIELSELIEGIGFKINRARFAKALLAEVPGANAKPTQAAASKVSQISNNSAAFKEYQTLNMNLSSVAERSSNIRPSNSAPGLAPSLPVEATTSGSAIRHSDIEQVNSTPNSRGPGLRGPYRKTREHMSEAKSSSSSSKPRRGPRRPRKHGLPSIKVVPHGPHKESP